PHHRPFPAGVRAVQPGRPASHPHTGRKGGGVMSVLLTVLGGAAWVLSRLGLALLVLLAVVLALALLALLIPFCADVAWEGEEGSPDSLGRLRVRAGALGLTVPVFEYPKRSEERRVG